MPTRGEGNRQYIIGVATRLFYQRGYNQTSFRDIAEASGIPKGNFYYYFKSKDELLNSVIDSVLETMNQRFRQLEAEFDRPLSRLKQLVGLLGEMSDDVMQYGCPLGSLSVELGKNNQELKSSASELFKVLQNWIKQQFSYMGKSEREAENLSLELLAKIQGVIIVGHALEDKTYLLNEIQKIAAWLEQQ